MLNEKTVVTPSKPIPKGVLHLFGTITSHTADPLTGERLNLVLWNGARKAIPYHDDELAIVD